MYPFLKFIFFVVSPLITTNGFAIEKTAVPLALGYGKLAYELPQVGSYALPALGQAADAKVLNEKGESHSLHQLYAGKYTLLSFIYSNCSDVNGCPLTSYVFYKLKKRKHQYICILRSI